ncbi:MAG: DUF4278 domain-containing protein [Cyanobacteria bacterium P01_A01_bin.17]
MKLTYRGTTYTATSPAMPTIEVIDTPVDNPTEGIFLGARFKLNQPRVTVRHQRPVQLTYRGVAYTR